jgi:serine/threonine protein kinase
MAWPPPTIEKAPGAGDDGAAPGDPSPVKPSPSVPPQNGLASRPPGPPPLNGPPRVSREPSGVPLSVAQAASPEWLRNPQSLLGYVLEGRYRVHTLVGRGAQGLVVEGVALATGKPVVLKLLPLPPGLTQERFVWRVREATALSHFEHQNVEPVFDFGALPDSGMFLVRSHVVGTPLRLALRQGRMPINRVLQIGRQLAHALTSAHTREIVHGRLKPENVLLAQHSDGSDTIKLIDFALGTLATSASSIAYASEDQRSLALRTRLYWPGTYDGSVPAEPHIDLHSLGVVLYEMIAGQPPTLFDTTELGLQPPRPAPPFAHCSPPLSVPKPVEDVVLTLLHPDLPRRGPTAEQVFGALDALLSGRTPAATHTPSSILPAVAVPAGPSQRTPSAAPPAPNEGRPPSPLGSQRAPVPPSRRRSSPDMRGPDMRGPVPAPPSVPSAAPPRAPEPPSAPAWVPAAAPASWAPGHVISGPIPSVDFNPSGAPPPNAVLWPQPPQPSPEALMAKTWPPASVAGPSAASPLASAAAQMAGPPLNRSLAPPPVRLPDASSPATWPPPTPVQSGPNSWLPPASVPATRRSGPPPFGATWPPGGGLPAGGIPVSGGGLPAGGVPPPTSSPPRSGPPPYLGPGGSRPPSSARGAPTIPPSNGPISIPRPNLPSGAPLLPDDEDENALRSGLGGTWSKIKGLVSRKKPRFDDDDDI